MGIQARIKDFKLGGALLGEGFGDSIGPQRIQGSARWGDRWGEAQALVSFKKYMPPLPPYISKEEEGAYIS